MMRVQSYSTREIFLSVLDIDATLTHSYPCSIREWIRRMSETLLTSGGAAIVCRERRAREAIWL